MGLWIGAGVLGGLSTRGVLEAASAQAAAAPDATILVSLYLDGGNDGLNTLVPLADPLYPTLRSRLGIAPETTLALPDTTAFGWHPALAGLKALYDQGKVAVLPSVDFADADQSHFNSAAYWRRGIVGPVLRDHRVARAHARRGRARWTTRSRASARRGRPTRC